MSKRTLIRASGAILAGLFVIAALVLVVGGYGYYRYTVREIQDEKAEELKAIATLKVGQIVNWRNERLADARMNSPRGYFVWSCCTGFRLSPTTP